MLTTRGRVLAGALAVAGCAGPGQMYVASNTVVGVHAAVNTARTAGSLQIGYDRQFATIVPRSVTPQDTDGAGLPPDAAAREVMSAVNCSELEVDGIFVSRFVENLAVGRAARNYALSLADPDDAVAQPAKDFFACKESQ